MCSCCRQEILVVTVGGERNRPVEIDTGCCIGGLGDGGDECLSGFQYEELGGSGAVF